MKNKKRNYFGSYPFVNIFISKLIFWGLNYRKKQLLKKYKNQKLPVQLTNNENTRAAFEKYLKQGYTKISLGGGNKNLEGFVNVDFIKHPDVEREVVANILDLSFIPDNSIDFIHSNHVMEHLTQQQLEEQLEQYKRILKKDGRISIRCPNCLGVAYGFFFGQTPERDHEKFLALGFPKDEDFYHPEDGWYYQDLWALYHWFYAYTGNKENEHLNQLTPTKLYDTIEQKGFKILINTIPEASNLVVIAQKQ